MTWMIRSPFRLVLVALTAVLVAVGAGVLLVSRGNDSSGVIESYYFQAHIEAHLSPVAADDHVLDTVRAWYVAPDRWRFEFGDFKTGEPQGGSLQVSDGKTLWLYDVDTNTYTRQPLDAYFRGTPPEFRSPPTLRSLSLLIGPMPGGDPGAFLMALAPDGARVESVDGSEIAGRPTELVSVDTGPAAFVKLWLDRVYAFALRYENSDEAADMHIEAEVTSVSFNSELDPSLFAFAPPPGSIEVEAGDGGSVSGSGSAGGSVSTGETPEGFFEPAYIPDGYEIVGYESAYGSSRVTAYKLHLETPSGGAYLDVDQQYRAGGMAESQRVGSAVAVRDTTGYLRFEGDVSILVWSRGDDVITLRATQLDREQLLRVAESMH